MSEAVLLDAVDHGLDEDDAGDLLQLQHLHEGVDGIGGGDEVVGHLARKQRLPVPSLRVPILIFVGAIFEAELTAARDVFTEVVLSDHSEHSATRFELNSFTDRLQDFGVGFLDPSFLSSRSVISSPMPGLSFVQCCFYYLISST